MVTVLSEADVEAVLELETLLPVVREALVVQSRGDVERPPRPHYPVGTGLDDDAAPAGTGLAMPAYIHGDDHFGTKVAAVHEANPERDLPTVHAQLVLADARTGVPRAFMGATALTNARTGCVGGLAVRALAPDASTLGVVGAGAQARWQARAVALVADLESVRIYAPSDSREACAADLRDRGIPATAVPSPGEAVAGSDVVVTATTSTEPVFPADALDAGALVVAIGAYTAEMQELDAAVLQRAERVFADVPGEVATIGDIQATSLSESDLVDLGAVLADGYRRATPDGVLVVESVGSAVMDVAAAQTIYEQAARSDVGTELSLW